MSDFVKMLRNGGVFLLIALAIAVANWLSNLLGHVVSSPITPFVFLSVLIMGITAGVNFIRKMTGGSNFTVKNFNSYAFWELAGTFFFSSYHFRFWALGMAIGFIFVLVAVLPKYMRAKWAKVFAGFLTVCFFAFAVWWSGQFFWIIADITASIHIILVAHAGNFWHILSTISATTCSIWIFWVWSKKLP